MTPEGAAAGALLLGLAVGVCDYIEVVGVSLGDLVRRVKYSAIMRYWCCSGSRRCDFLRFVLSCVDI